MVKKNLVIAKIIRISSVITFVIGPVGPDNHNVHYSELMLLVLINTVVNNGSRLIDTCVCYS